MKRKILVVSVLVVVVLGVYLNRSYAHIYDKIGFMNLQSSDTEQIYKVGKVSDEKIIYVAIGDSLTAGVGVDDFSKSYPYQVAEKISHKGKHVTMNIQAISGGRSADIVDRFIEPTIKANPDVITLFVGVNDVHGNISEKVFKENYETILGKLTQQTKAKIYIINIPYLGTKSLILPPYDFYYDKQTREFNEILKSLADSYNVSYIDLYSKSLKPFSENSSNYSVDLFHPSAIGYKLWAEIIYAGINK